VDVPTCVDGRTLKADKAGDSSDWIEIARNGDCSLIIRCAYIKFNCASNPSLIKYLTTFCPKDSYAYSNSYVRRYINAFFNGTATGKADSLLPGCRLRNYALRHNAASVMGTVCTLLSLSDGFSKPTTTKASSGDDVCFVLSYTEAANFCSKTKYMFAGNGFTLGVHPVPSLAVNNFKKLTTTGTYIWCRNQGSILSKIAAICCGKVYQHLYSCTAVIHPALWVDSAIFD